jgi:RNA polymerase sigma factor (sigma-70 family)
MASRGPGSAWFGSRGASGFDSCIWFGTIRADTETDVIKSALLKRSPPGTFESLYGRHVQDVYRYCRAMLDRQADAEDATQTTFLNAYRALEQGEQPRDPGSWLRAIALNVCREHHRRAGRRPDEVSLEDDPGELVREPPGPELGDIVRGLSSLPFNQRAALVMREFEGRSLPEISAALGVSVSAVEALLFRSRRSLREQLEEKLTCGEAERAISRQLDGALPRRERGRLRAHLRECRDCAALARRARAQRSAIRSLAFLPLPASLRLSKLFGGAAAPASASAPSGVPAGGSALALGSVAAKVAAVALAGAAAVGLGYETFPKQHPSRASAPPRRAAAATSGALPRTPARALPRPHRVTVAPRAIRRVDKPRPAPARAERSSHRRTASPQSSSHATATTQTIARAPASSTASSTASSSAAATAGHGKGHASTGNGHRAPTTPAAHGNQKPFKGQGHAYGRSKPKGAKPAPAAQTTSGPPSTPPGQAKPHANQGQGHKQ